LPKFGGFVALDSLPNDTATLVNRDEATAIMCGLRPLVVLVIEAKGPGDATASGRMAVRAMQDPMTESGGLAHAPLADAALKRLIITDIAIIRGFPMMAARATRAVGKPSRRFGRCAIMSDRSRCPCIFIAP
jgi:hypothetical protein